MAIRVETAAGLASFAFSRPEKKNAITAAMYQALVDALRHAEQDPAVRVMVITGEGGSFTAGNDLEDFLKHPPQGDASPVSQFMNALRDATKPVVAAVPGMAIGIGTTLLMHCDLVYAADKAKFAMPFTSLGLCPEFASSLLLPKLAGYQRAAEKLLLGEAFDAHDLETRLFEKPRDIAVAHRHVGCDHGDALHAQRCKSRSAGLRAHGNGQPSFLQQVFLEVLAGLEPIPEGLGRDAQHQAVGLAGHG
jgi:hypothetical protein